MKTPLSKCLTHISSTTLCVYDISKSSIHYCLLKQMTAHGTAQENGKPQIVMFLKDLWVVRREQTKNTQNAIKETAQQEHT